MTPVFSGRTKLLYFALAKWALAKSIIPFLCHSTKKWRKKRNQRLRLWKPFCAPRGNTVSSDRGAKINNFNICERVFKLAALTRRYKLLLSTPAARGICRRAMHKKYIRLSPLSALKSGTKREIQEGTPWHVFLVTSLTCVKEVTSKMLSASARSSASVPRSSRSKSPPNTRCI